MACQDSADASTALDAAVASPRRSSVDGTSVDSHSLPDLIKADQYLAGKCAANSKTRGIRFNRFIPDGTTGRRYRGGDGGSFGWNRD